MAKRRNVDKNSIEWITSQYQFPNYSRAEVNKAGKYIAEHFEDEDDVGTLLDNLFVIDNWRAAHAYPLRVFFLNFRKRAEGNENIIVAQRLKRISSIVRKLRDDPTSKLARMQDLGGCRMIINGSVQDVYGQVDKFKKSSIRHIYRREKDYIKDPKPSGYRSFHLVYEYHSEAKSKEKYNCGLEIELQFRTQLQHIWATALETLAAFESEDLKSGKGRESYKRFFALVSSLFAMEEKTPLVPGADMSKEEIIEEIKLIDGKEKIIDKLKAANVSIKHEEIKGHEGYCILSLNYEKHILNIKDFKASDYELAIKMYEQLEKENRDKNMDTVLVRTESFDDLREAYPNYFLDVKLFVEKVQSYIENY